MRYEFYLVAPGFSQSVAKGFVGHDPFILTQYGHVWQGRALGVEEHNKVSERLSHTTLRRGRRRVHSLIVAVDDEPVQPVFPPTDFEEDDSFPGSSLTMDSGSGSGFLFQTAQEIIPPIETWPGQFAEPEASEDKPEAKDRILERIPRKKRSRTSDLGKLLDET